MSNLTFQFSGESQTATKFVGKSRNFEIIIDEPEELGGKDEAANPVEYTLASLAGCLNVVGHVVAKEQGLTINSLKIDITGELNPEKFLGVSATERAGFKSITANLHVDTDATAEAISEWQRIVKQRCPVSDNLGNDTPLEVKIA